MSAEGAMPHSRMLCSKPSARVSPPTRRQCNDNIGLKSTALRGTRKGRRPSGESSSGSLSHAATAEEMTSMAKSSCPPAQHTLMSSSNMSWSTASPPARQLSSSSCMACCTAWRDADTPPTSMLLHDSITSALERCHCAGYAYSPTNPQISALSNTTPSLRISCNKKSEVTSTRTEAKSCSGDFWLSSAAPRNVPNARNSRA
mmetsp:Transcript_4464/g.7591  ORF Transcript_4464/g.7591 Transcript_4464/m.7591 type:complete len:202 (+) Transcript_4464:400-1005(+)